MVKLTYLVILAVFGIASVSAGFSNWFGGSEHDDHDDDDDSDVRERRQAPEEKGQKKCPYNINEIAEGCCKMQAVITDAKQKENCKHLKPANMNFMKSRRHNGPGKKTKKQKKAKTEVVVKRQAPTDVTEPKKPKGERLPFDKEAMKKYMQCYMGDYVDTNMKFNINKYKDDFLSKNADTKLQANMEQAVKDCTATDSVAGKPCLGKVFNCVQKYMLLNCPAELQNPDAACSGNVTLLKTCVPYHGPGGPGGARRLENGAERVQQVADLMEKTGQVIDMQASATNTDTSGSKKSKVKKSKKAHKVKIAEQKEVTE